MTVAFPFFGDQPSRARLQESLVSSGYALCTPDPRAFELSSGDPWEAAAFFLGDTPEMVERQPIAAVPWGRSFASTSGETPLHTDSQLLLGVPPQLQFMFCVHAVEGGDTLLLDSHALLDDIEREAPELFAQLFDVPRRLPFVFGDVLGPTLSLRGESVVFTHSPRPRADDTIALGLRAFIARTSLLRVQPRDGELLVVDNHRMLHGRTAFSDESRQFTRLLVWPTPRLPYRGRWLERLRAATEHQALALARLSAPAQRRLGLEPEDATGAARLRIVLEMLRGVPPGVLARRYDVAEATLYTWRDGAVAAGRTALARADEEEATSASELDAFLARRLTLRET